MLSNARNKLRRYVSLIYPYLILICIIYVFYYGYNIVISGRDFYSTLIIGIIVFGFFISLYPKYSYVGSIIMSVATLYLVILSLMSIFFAIKWYQQVLITSFLSLFMILFFHIITMDIRLLTPSSKSIFFSTLSYIITTLFIATAFGGLNIKSNLMVPLITIFYIIFSLVVRINRGFRESKINEIINISNLNTFFNLYENMKKKYTNHNEKINIIISEFRDSISSFIDGDFERVVESSYRSLEGLDRILEWSNKNKLNETKFKQNYKKISDWRNKIAHSNVSKKGKKKNRFKIGGKNAFNSLQITNEIIYYYSKKD